MNQMLDCENRANAAHYFLDRARDRSLSESQHTWYTQATVIFAIASVENLLYDYAERKTGESLKGRNLSRSDFRNMTCTAFCDWLEEREAKSDLYRFLRNERNLVAHRGEPPKKVRLDIRQPLGSGEATWTVTHYFEGWENQSIDEACQLLIDWVDNVIQEAKQNFPELVFFLCKICGFGYADEATAQSCEDFCKTHNACSFEITMKAAHRPRIPGSRSPSST
jgi:hypothetical protein